VLEVFATVSVELSVHTGNSHPESLQREIENPSTTSPDEPEGSMVIYFKVVAATPASPRVTRSTPAEESKWVYPEQESNHVRTASTLYCQNDMRAHTYFHTSHSDRNLSSQQMPCESMNLLAFKLGLCRWKMRSVNVKFAFLL
jgi:hypothetical protein